MNMVSRYAPLETSVTRSILNALAKVPGCFAVKMHGGPYRAGQPDILGCYKGRAFAIEVKRPTTRCDLTARQEAALARWREAGAIAAVCTSKEEALQLLGARISNEIRCPKRGRDEEEGVTMGRDELLDVIRLALFKCGLYHDDVEWMASLIERDIEDYLHRLDNEKVGGTD